MPLRGSSFVLFLFGMLTFCANATIQVKHFNTKAGLVNNTVRCFHEDKDGKLWIGTDGGISIYNGYSFISISTKDGLIGNYVWAIVNDDSGGKWIASYNDGLTYVKNGKYIRFNQKQGLLNLNIRTIHFQNKKLFIGTENGIFIYDYASKKIKDITPKSNESEDFQVMQFLNYSNDLIVVTRKRGLYKVVTKSDLNVQLMKLGKGPTVFKIVPFSSKILYCNTIGIYRQDKLLSTNGVLINGNVVWEYTKSLCNKSIYLGTWNVTQAGGALLKLQKDSLIDITKRYAIQSEAIWSVKWLSSNQLAVGTLDKGFYLVDLQNDQADKSSLKKIKGRFEIDGITYYYSEKKVFQRNGKVLLELSEGNLKKWFNQKGVVLQKLNDLSSSYKDLSLKGHRINYVKSTNHGVFVSTSLGLICCRKDFKIERFIPLVIDNFHVFNNTLIYQKPYKEFNVFRNLVSTNVFREVIPITTKMPDDILHFRQLGDSTVIWTKVKGVFVYRDGLLPYQLKLKSNIGNLKIAVSWGNKFLLVNSKDEVFKAQISSGGISLKKIRLPIAVKSIYNVAMCGENYAIHFDRGIYVSTPSHYRIVNNKNMLSPSEVNTIFMNGKLLEVVTDEFIHHIPISSIFNYIHKYPKAEISITCNTIPFNQNSLVLSVKKAAIQFPKDYSFFYQLNGQDTVPLTEDKIYLMNLSSGSYKINLLAHNGFTNSWALLDSSHFTKEKALWEKTYFWFVLTSLISLVGVIIYYRRKVARDKQLIQKQELEKEVIQQKLQAIQAKMNPHFMFNALNSIQNYIIDTDTDNALLYLSEFAKLMRQTIEYSSLNAISLTEELEFLKRYIRIEQMRFSSEIEVLIEGTEISESIKLPPMILQPLIENAFIHGLDTQAKTKQQIQLKLEKRDESWLLITISNPKSNTTSSFKEHQSFGIKSIEQRLKLVHSANTLKTFETATDFTVHLEICMSE